MFTMFVPFRHTLQARERDRVGRPLAQGALALVLLLAWSTWFTRARVTLRETTRTARIEVRRAGNSADAAAAGRIVAVHAALGALVGAGDVLFELDTAIAEERLAEAEARHGALASQIAARQKEVDALAALERRLLDHRREAIAEARVNRARAEADARRAAEQSARYGALHRVGVVSALDALGAQGAAEDTGAAAAAAGIAIRRLQKLEQTETAEVLARLARLRSEITDLQAQRGTTRAAALALRRELDGYTIRAPVSGRIAELTPRRRGAWVEVGEHLATVVPEGELRAVAEFPPQAALGRIRPGQRARLSLDGFPFTRYGMLEATVAEVGAEVREGRVRVELELAPDAATRIPLQHGLPGSAEIEVEACTPWQLARNAAGRLLSGSDQPAGAS